MVGAAPVSRELQTAYMGLFPNAAVGQAFGMTETSTSLYLRSRVGRVGFFHVYSFFVHRRHDLDYGQ